MAQNNTYKQIWNPILNALPKSQRREFKETMIAQPNRQMVGTPMYRVLNVFVDTVSPTVGHPWAESVPNLSQPLETGLGQLLATENNNILYTE
jgi:hypothetical protein